MRPIEMVPLVQVGSAMEAKLVAARLGAAGIVVELRGPVDDPYPLGDVTVLVDADSVDLARALLVPVDGADAGWPGDDDHDHVGHAGRGVSGLGRRRLVALAGLVAVGGFAVARIAGAAL